MIACLNYLALPSVNTDTKKALASTGQAVPAKLKSVFKDLNIPLQGPLWNLVVKAASLTISKQAFSVASPTQPSGPSCLTEDLAVFLLPLVKLREAKNWATIGFKTLARIQTQTLIQLFGRVALE